MKIDQADQLICAALRNAGACWPREADGAFAGTLLQRASYHGVQPLLHERPLEDWRWPAGVRQSLRTRSLGQATYELRHQEVLSGLLTHLHSRDIGVLFIKGTALAYDVYSSPVLRSRGDTDIFIARHQRQGFKEAAAEAGFAQTSAMSADFVSYQSSYAHEAPDGSVHDLDVHWKINNAPMLAGLFGYDELLTRSRAIPRLHPMAKAPSRADAMLLACIHRAVHVKIPYYVGGTAHFGGDRLIWLYDIDLLARGFTSNEWTALIDLATSKGLCAVCLESLEMTQARLATPLPGAAIAALRSARKEEPIRAYLTASAARQSWMDFIALGGGRARLSYVGETFFPPRAYMQQKYRSSRLRWLPWLYARRAAGGVVKALSRVRRRA